MAAAAAKRIHFQGAWSGSCRSTRPIPCPIHCKGYWT